VKSIFDVKPAALIAATATALEAVPEIKAPEWLEQAKSGSHNERITTQKGFWHIRLGSLLRTVALDGPVGVRHLRTKYGGRTQHIVRRSHHRPAGGKIIRLGLQQLEKAGFIAKADKKHGFGRVITRQGTALLEKAARTVTPKAA
jgi:small subunit ribosomal protein S19e